MNWLQKIAGDLSDVARQRLDMAGAKVVESGETENYEIYLIYIPQIDIYQVGFQRKGRDFTDLQQQYEKTPFKGIQGLSEIGPLKDIIENWIQKYGTIYVISHNLSKNTVYSNLLSWLGFNPRQESIMDQPVIAIG